MKRWRHNDGKHQWELGYDDVPRMEFVVLAWVTDELIERAANPELVARHIKRKMGSVPPPWQQHLEPPAREIWLP
jgi:hypothetical protein